MGKTFKRNQFDDYGKREKFSDRRKKKLNKIVKRDTSLKPNDGVVVPPGSGAATREFI